MATVKSILLGIDGLSYGYFMKCQPKVIMSLFNSTFRGVVENYKAHDIAQAWATVLSGRLQENRGFLKQLPTFPLVERTKAVLVNVPVTNPTAGEACIPYDSKVPAEEEVGIVRDAILTNIEKRPVIASITPLNRGLDICQSLKYIDELVKAVVNKVDEFIIFSPFGAKKNTGYEPFGVYISSRPRPDEHGTVKLEDISELFIEMVVGVNSSQHT